MKGPTSLEALKTVNGIVHQTYQGACLELGMLEGDNHWDITLTKAAVTSFPSQIRTLFAIILTTCAPSDPKGLWETHKENLSENILNQTRRANLNLELQFTLEFFNETLVVIEEKCIEIDNKSLSELGLPTPTRNSNILFDKDLN